MRKDLNKQLCERERIGHTRSFKDARRDKTYAADDEIAHTRESMKERYRAGWNYKEFNENLNPLYGAVRKGVGKRWDTFYSELCQVFDKRSVINQHILDHLKRYVSLDVKVDEDGELYEETARRKDYLRGTSLVEYYVDPRDGILKRNKWYKPYKAANREDSAKRAAERAKNVIRLDERTLLRKIDDVWYEYELKKIPEGTYEISKPLDRELFRSYRSNTDVAWERLNSVEKRINGSRKFVGKSALDVFIGKRIYSFKNHVYLENGSPDSSIDRQVDQNIFSEKLYHASKRSASHKTLKKAGLA